MVSREDFRVIFDKRADRHRMWKESAGKIGDRFIMTENLENIVLKKTLPLTQGVFVSRKISNVTFENVTLTDVLFLNCEMDNVTFLNTDLCSATFYNVKMNDCKFSGCMAKNLFIKQSVLSGVYFYDSDLENAKFSDLRINKSKFEHIRASFCSLCYLTIDDCALHDVKFAKGYFNTLDLKCTNYTDVIFDSSTFVMTEISESEFLKCSLRNTYYTECMISCRYYAANFDGASFEDCDVTISGDANLNKASFDGMSYREYKEDRRRECPGILNTYLKENKLLDAVLPQSE